jgi:hypothetical protein
MRGAPHDSAQANGPDLARSGRIGHVVLLELAGAPAGHVQHLIIDGQVDVADQRRDRREGSQGGRQIGRVRRLGRNRNDLLCRPVRPVAVPPPLGAAGAVSAICLPFFLMAPGDMFRMVVTDQLGRQRMHITLIERLYSLSSVRVWMPDARSLSIMVASGGVLTLTALLLAWHERSGRVVIVLLVTQTALLLQGPSYFPATRHSLYPPQR